MTAYWQSERPGPAAVSAGARRTTARAVDIVIGRFQSTVVVTLHGALDPGMSAELGCVLDDLIDGQGNLAVVMDLRDLRRIDCSGVEALRAAARQMAARGGRLRLAGPVGSVLDSLTLSGLASLIDTSFEDEHRRSTHERPGRRAGRQAPMNSHPAGNTARAPATTVKNAPSSPAPPHVRVQERDSRQS